jgi:hypothetical protein
MEEANQYPMNPEEIERISSALEKAFIALGGFTEEEKIQLQKKLFDSRFARDFGRLLDLKEASYKNQSAVVASEDYKYSVWKFIEVLQNEKLYQMLNEAIRRTIMTWKKSGVRYLDIGTIDMRLHWRDGNAASVTSAKEILDLAQSRYKPSLVKKIRMTLPRVLHHILDEAIALKTWKK